MTVGHIQHHVDIFNMRLKGGSKELVYIFQLFVYKFLNKVSALKRVLALLFNLGSSFSARTISFCLFSNGSPCTSEQYSEYLYILESVLGNVNYLQYVL